MKRPIDANALIGFLHTQTFIDGDDRSLVYRWIEEQPTIEPEVRHGRWIPTEYDSYSDGSPVWDKYECSECGREHSGEEDTLTAFCPDCGARMDGGTNND